MEDWWVGIDWAKEHHQVELQRPDGTVVWNETYGAQPEHLYELRDELLEHCGGAEHLKVGIEDPGRGIVRMFLEAGVEVFVLPPRKLDALRTAYSEAQAKDDELDAHILCDELRVHRNVFYPVVPRPPVVEALSRYHRGREREKKLINQASNRLRDLLQDYFPQFLELDWSLTDRVMVDLLELIPTPSAAEQVTVEQVENVLGRCRKHSAQEVLEILTAKAPRLPQRVVEATAELACREAETLRSALQTAEHWADKIVELLEEISKKQKSGELPSSGSEQREADETDSRSADGEADEGGPAPDRAEGREPVSDIEIAMSTRGVGVHTVAGLFAEGFEALVALDREMLRRQSIAPVTKQTGRQSTSGQGPPPKVQQRHARNRHLTDTLHQIGDSLQRQNAHYRANYQAMREHKDHTHGRSCRQICDQYLRVLFAMLRDRTMYDPDLHGATRR